jgi:flavodoxin
MFPELVKRAAGGYVRGLVVYDSVFGNTKQVAEAIAEQIRADGHSAELVSLRSGGKEQAGADFMFVGGPTRIKKMTRHVKRFMKGLDKGYWSSRPICAFDTHGLPGKTEEERRKGDKWINPGAAGGIIALGGKLGLKMQPTPLRCAVMDMKGPLEPGSLEKAKAFTHGFVASLHQT